MIEVETPRETFRRLRDAVDAIGDGLSGFVSGVWDELLDLTWDELVSGFVLLVCVVGGPVMMWFGVDLAVSAVIAALNKYNASFEKGEATPRFTRTSSLSKTYKGLAGEIAAGFVICLIGVAITVYGFTTTDL